MVGLLVTLIIAVFLSTLIYFIYVMYRFITTYEEASNIRSEILRSLNSYALLALLIIVYIVPFVLVVPRYDWLFGVIDNIYTFNPLPFIKYLALCLLPFSLWLLVVSLVQTHLITSRLNRKVGSKRKRRSKHRKDREYAGTLYDKQA